MLFMDYRRHHTGIWEGSAPRLNGGNHPNANDGLWGSAGEAPSFLYAMPLGNGRVFLEETCLVARPALPFNVLKRRLERRMAAMGVRVKQVHEEEWSYIPVGGPLPAEGQAVAAFGAAANLVHPATGFSVSRSLREAPAVADAAAAALRAPSAGAREAAAAVWGALWPAERRRQAAFHLFGMELLTQLDLAATDDFFRTFFALPPAYWRGFLGSSLSSAQLVVFALLTFVLAPVGIKAKLVSHLMSGARSRGSGAPYRVASRGPGCCGPTAALRASTCSYMHEPGSGPRHLWGPAATGRPLSTPLRAPLLD
jgi:lycopene epsilon-cyclase